MASGQPAHSPFLGAVCWCSSQRRWSPFFLQGAQWATIRKWRCGTNDSNLEGDVMVWPRQLWLRLQTLLRPNRSAQRLDDEIQFHLEQQTAENIPTGMSPEEARYAAVRAFGNATVLKEKTRDTWGWTWL